MASVRKLPSGKWNIQIRRKGRPPLSKTFTNKSDGMKWLHQTESEIERDVFVDRSESESTTLGEALQRYLREVTPLKKGAVQEKLKIDKWLRHPLAMRSLASLKPVDFAVYRDKRLQEVSNATVRLELAVVSHLFTICIKEWSLEGLSNPLSGIRKPKPSNARTRRLTISEMKRLLAACKQSNNKLLLPLVEIALQTAMRLGEILSLKWEQVSIENRTISLYDTKNGDDRTIPLSSRAVEILQSIPKKEDEKRIFYLWAARSDCIKKSWGPAKEKAGIEDFHFHDLRHEATSRFFEIGLNAMEVASITGHKSMQMLKRYTHPRASDLAEKLEALNSPKFNID